MQHEISEMASGGFSLELDPESTWDQYLGRSKYWVKKLGAKQIGKPIITGDECILEVKLGSGFFWITFDETQKSIQLEPQDQKLNGMVLIIQSRLIGET